MKEEKRANFIMVDRGLFKSPLWSCTDVFCRRAAFIDLLQRARWSKKPSHYMKGDKVVIIGKDQIPISEKHLCERWKWSNTKVRSFLAMLVKSKIIKIESASGVNQTIITFLKYANYDHIFIKSKKIKSGKTVEKPQINSYNNIDNIEEKKKEEREYPYQDIIEAWNQICTNFESVSLSDNRKGTIKKILDQQKIPFHESLPRIIDVFTKVNISDFLCGKNNNFKADIDWVFASEDNFIKISEGKYDNKINKLNNYGKIGEINDSSEIYETSF